MEGLSVRLNPANVQASALARACGARRFCANWCVAQVHANHATWKSQEAGGVPKADRIRLLSAMDLEQAWRRERPPWAAEVSSWVFSWACRDIAQAQRNFLAGRARLPRFAKKGCSRARFSIAGRDVTLEAGRVQLPKIGWVPIAGADAAQSRLRRLLRRGRARIVSATVARHADGTWWLSTKIERQISRPSAHPRPDAPVVGVDRGITTLAVAATATGVVVGALAAGRRRRDAQPQLRRAQQRLTRRRPRPGHRTSRNFVKAKAMVGRLHAKVARQRANDLHCFSAALVKAAPVIVLETLTTKNLLKNRPLAAAIADQGWAELGRQFTYKAEWAGGQVLLAPRFFPSSKTCARCGSVKPKLTLAERRYRCDVCGHDADRDRNAAATLAAWGEHTLGCCPCVIQARDPDPPGRSGTSIHVHGRFHACGGWMSVPSSTQLGSVSSDEAGTSQPLDTA
jgi:putative transposase